MRASFYERTGPAGEVLTLGELPAPEPGPGEVRVRLAYSGVNPSDVKSRAGLSRLLLPPPEAGPMSEPEIDENLTETFPASDPPSWTTGTDHAPSGATGGGQRKLDERGPDKETRCPRARTVSGVQLESGFSLRQSPLSTRLLRAVASGSRRRRVSVCAGHRALRP